MESIIYVSMDVHKSRVTLGCLEPILLGQDHYFGEHKIEASAKAVKKYLSTSRKRLNEVGWCGYSLQRGRTAQGVEYVILVPTNISRVKDHTIKTDARLIARSPMTRSIRSSSQPSKMNRFVDICVFAMIPVWC